MSKLIIAFVIIGLILLSIALPVLSLEFANKISFHPEKHGMEQWHLYAISGLITFLGVIFIGCAIYMGITVATLPTSRTISKTSTSYSKWSGPIEGLPGLSYKKDDFIKPTNEYGPAPHPDRPPSSNYQSAEKLLNQGKKRPSEYADLSRLSGEFSKSATYKGRPHSQSTEYGSIPSIESNYGAPPKKSNYGRLLSDEELERREMSDRMGYGSIPSME